MPDFDFVPIPPGDTGEETPPATPAWSVRKQDARSTPQIWDPNQVTPAARANRALANAAHRGLQVLFTLSSVVGALLVIRMLLVAFKASPSAPFVQFVLDRTSAWLAPFKSMFNNADWGGHTIEVNTLIALVFYALVLLFLVKIIEALLTPRRTPR